jgi:quinol monooxygenase YgiN
MDENGGRWRIIIRRRRFQMDKMCTVIAYFFAKPEKREELEKFCAALLLKRGRNRAASIMSDDDPNVFEFYENWRSRNDWDEHNQKPFLIFKSFSKNDVWIAAFCSLTSACNCLLNPPHGITAKEDLACP